MRAIVRANPANRHSKWRCLPCARWLRAACTIIWAAVFIVTRSIVTGTYPISKRCFTIRRSSPSPISTRFRITPEIAAISKSGLRRDILDYVARDMTSKEGGFFSAEDADSLFEQRQTCQQTSKAHFMSGRKKRSMRLSAMPQRFSILFTACNHMETRRKAATRRTNSAAKIF